MIKSYATQILRPIYIIYVEKNESINNIKIVTTSKGKAFNSINKIMERLQNIISP